MIIILNGSIGVGKTSVSWDLLDVLEKAVMLDGDYYAAFSGYRIGHHGDLAYVFDALLHQMHFHVQHGYRNFIINYVFTQKSDLEAWVERCLKAFDMPVYIFDLVCDPIVQEKRILKRNNDQWAWELERMEVLNSQLKKEGSARDLGELIDTSTRTSKEVALYIRQWLKG